MRVAELRQAGLKSWQEGNSEQAIGYLRQAAQLSPADPGPWLDLAECLWASYEFDEALRTYSSAMDLGGNDPAVCLQAAQKLFSLGRFASSAAWLERAAGLTPASAEARVMLGEVYERCDRLEAAEQQAREALLLRPGSVKAIRLLAHVERRRSRFEEARELLQGQLQDHPGPEDWRLRVELAAVLDRLGEYDRAFQMLILSRQQLWSVAAPLLEQAQAVRQRQEEIAHTLRAEDFKAWRAPAPARPLPMAILCGHPRSGTTLLEQILGAHPGVVTTDETGVWQREFLEPIMRQAASAGASVEELRGFTAEQLNAGRQAYLRFTQAHVGQDVHGRLLLEKDPSLTPDLPLPLRLFPEAKILFPLRDPRDICISYFFTILPLNRGSAHALTLEATAEFCAHSFRLWQHWRPMLASPYLETRYERLVADPPTEARRILQFLGLDWDEGMLQFHQQRRGVRTPTYADVTQPIYSRSIGRWKNYAKHLAPCQAVLEPILAAFEYAP